MTYTCPQGHQSSTADFCDVCGEPIDATTPSALSPPGGAQRLIGARRPLLLHRRRRR